MYIVLQLTHMPKLTLLFFIFIVVSVNCIAQNATINGTVEDTINRKTLPQTSISLLRAKDSVLVDAVRSDSKGQFKLSKLAKGQYIVLFSYPTYADYLDKVTVDENENKFVGKIMLTLKSKILEEVLVKSKVAAIRMRGDTTEYTADSFKVREGASVEEMLRKLPGLQVR